MGLLDDAIKEHLELKRRHGADPSEVARLEHEALGPARREPASAVAPVADEPALVDEDGLDDKPMFDDEAPIDDVPLLDDDTLLDDDGYDDEVTADERLEAPVHRSPPPAAPPEPEPEAEAAAPPEPETVDQPTRQFSLQELDEAAKASREAAPPAEDEPEPHADVVPADDEPENDDVLEDTPEFLQETPEHDRLWFEQKPPRDFDF
jgi:hypothetical protein